jgi:hypothetical protein
LALHREIERSAVIQRLRSVSLAALAAAMLGGCVLARSSSYPAGWAAPDAGRIGKCPAIEGSYAGTGLMALESGVDCSGPRTAKTGEWHCSLDLAANLGLAASGGSSVQLRQPDDETLEVTVSSAGDPTRTVLKKGKDFSCDADSLYFSGTENVFGSKAMSAVGLVLLTGRVANHTRAFARAQSRELVMTVRGRMLFFYFGFPIVMAGTTHVRWTPSSPSGEPE